MNNPSTAPVVVRPDSDHDDIVHTACCIDEELALCGVEGLDTVHPNPQVLCVSCELAANYGTCPKVQVCVRDHERMS